MDSATARVTVMVRLVEEDGIEPELASWAALAMFPFDDRVKAGRKFRKQGRRLADLYADQAAGVRDAEHLRLVTLAFIEALHEAAEANGETYYRDHYANVLAAATQRKPS
jgi:hypothetical protein